MKTHPSLRRTLLVIMFAVVASLAKAQYFIDNQSSCQFIVDVPILELNTPTPGCNPANICSQVLGMAVPPGSSPLPWGACIPAAVCDVIVTVTDVGGNPCSVTCTTAPGGCMTLGGLCPGAGCITYDPTVQTFVIN